MKDLMENRMGFEENILMMDHVLNNQMKMENNVDLMVNNLVMMVNSLDLLVNRMVMKENMKD
jgi:hypothetical protein